MWRHVSIILLFITPPVWAACESAIPASTPNTQFSVPGDGTVNDLKTGLIWKQCSEGQTGATCSDGATTVMTWQQALQVSQTLNTTGGYAGFTDWRLPNLKELRSLVEVRCYSPSINSDIFPATRASVFWSSSPFAQVSGYAWVVHFNNGFSGYSGRTYSFRVRLVRGGQ
jgi:hypothetical protein